MNYRSISGIAALCVFGSLAIASDAFAAEAAAKVTIKKHVAIVQKSPDFLVKNVKDKKWSPRDWLEIEIPFVAEYMSAKGKREKVVPELTFEYYIYLDAKSKENARVLTATLNHVNIPAREKVASVVYVSPDAILRLTGEKRADDRQVRYVGVVVKFGGKDLMVWSSDGKKWDKSSKRAKPKFWWDSDKAPAVDASALLSKEKTPFAILWPDYHVRVAGSK